MTKPAVEFEVFDDEIHLVYRPRDNTSWVREKFERGDELLVKGTFHLTSRDLVEDAAEVAANAASDDDDIVWADDDRLVFAIAMAPPSLLFESRIQSIFTSASSAAATTARVKF